MSADFKDLIVSFCADLSEEKTQEIAKAIELIKGVGSVVNYSEAEPNDYMNRDKVRLEYRQKFVDFYKEIFK